MNGRMIDVAIAGGGLSGGLAALALHRARPELRLALIESGAALGGNHRWSWFASDVSAEGEELLARFRKTEWDGGYDVRFPGYGRSLATPYRSVASEDFAAALHRELPAGAIRTQCRVASLDARGIELEDGERIEARTVLDCRGFAPTAQLTGGWQVFMGRHLRTAQPHGVARPMIMDARVEQRAPAGDGGAYRFVYVLPLGVDELFVEDTYYADAPALDRGALSGRIDRYCQQAGWDGELLGFETGVLPVVTGGDFRAWQAGLQVDGVARLGARGGFFHPLTSYTLPQAVETALAVARDADLTGEQMAAMIAARARNHWTATRFYRILGAMLFGAARPEDRYRVFERFYRLPHGLIENFYAGRSSLAEKARVLAGKPPVPVLGALRALGGTGHPLDTAGGAR
ncbi:MAG: lycopene beta-cyclase CrtY [Sphingomonadales bacterium]|nr:lycopene beta-cyclase CrtY [Sphingomonadales bacterium]MBD3774654.1 lycopene beta-cyclase CrtY [Paracoccaceae bacterium]